MKVKLLSICLALTCAFNARGRITESIPKFEKGILTVDLTLRRKPTLYGRWGDLPVQLALGLWLGYVLGKLLLRKTGALKPR